MKYVGTKVGYFLLTVWAAVTLNFLIPRLQPGDPAQIIVRKLSAATGSGGQVDPSQVRAIQAMLGEPHTSLLQQYGDYLVALLQGRFGQSFTYYPFPVTQVIGQAVWWTVGLLGVTQILSFLIGTLLGAWAAWRRNTRFDGVVSIGSTFVGNLQSFWIALLVLFVFAYQVGWFPASGGYEYTTPGLNGPFLADVLSHAALPAFTLMITAPIGFILGMRNTMVQTLGEDYIRLAQAQGLTDRRVALGYAARNALLPSVTNFALSLGALFGGSVLVEQIFDYPGLGRLLAEATANRDFPLMQGILLLTIIAVLVANLAADLLYGVLDPASARLAEKEHLRVPHPLLPRRRRPERSRRHPAGRPVGRQVGLPGRPAPDPTRTAVSDADVATSHPPRWFAIIWSNGKARIGIVLLGLFVLMAVFAPLIAPYSPTDGTFAPVLPISPAHPLGTTSQGYDILSQFVYGTRLSLLVGLFGGLFATAIALVIGLVSGYAEGTLLDNVLSFFTNLALVVPVLPLMLVIVAYSETRGLGLLVFVIGITSWAGAARAKRSQIITLRNRDFVTAARFAGDSGTRVIFREILPNMTSLIVASFISAATGAIVAEAGLSFLGFSDPTNISWGQMLTQANANGALVQGLWVWLFVPGIALALLITSMAFINFGVDLLSNPHLRED